MSTHVDKYTYKIPPLCGVIKCAKTEEYSWMGIWYRRPILYFFQARV